MANSFYERPILNSPYEPPTLHHPLDDAGQPVEGEPIKGRRPSKFIVPVPASRKKSVAAQASLDLETYTENAKINEIRGYVDAWRAIPNPADWGVTPVSQRLLEHWRRPKDEWAGPRPFFCQLEAVETMIWLTEVAPRRAATRGLLDQIAKDNEEANPALFRLAMKMATGSGKTTVMAMLIAWQAINAARREAKDFSRAFLIVAPGITIKDRLRDAWGIADFDSYAIVQRMGRKSRLGPNQRERLWPVFDAVRAALAAERYTTWAQVFTGLADAFSGRSRKPFDHVVLDEAQDLAPAELRFFAALAPNRPDALFLAGDMGQRIFQHPYSWSSLGVEVRGRSHTLKVCYRTSQQIRQTADRLLPAVLRDVDGVEDERRGIVSVFDGPPPRVETFATIDEETGGAGAVIATWLAEGLAPEEIGIFVRTPDLVARARDAIRSIAGADRITTVPMHLAKRLEFRGVVVMACDQGILPLDERIADAADEAELDEIYETERRLLYVACTRAREHLLLTGVGPASEYLADFGGEVFGPRV